MNPIERPEPDAEEVLIGQAVQGSLEAFNQLVLHYQNIAYHYAYALLGDPAAADDVAQESFIKAFRNISGFRGGSFRAWLLKIVTNTAYDLFRQAKQHPIQPLFPDDEAGDEIESPDWLVDPSPSVEATVEQNEDAQRLYQLLDQLPEIHRSVLTLVDLYEMDYWEVAEILNVPMGTVKSRLARARLQLRRILLADSQYSLHLKPGVALLAS
jgi:RNA polymerase sigma-70 factor (ECF subfamily)